jgi:hypothetical protein
MIPFLRAFTLLLAATAFGVTLGHVLERPAKSHYPDPFYAAVNSTLYGGYALVGALTMPAGIVASAALTYLLHRRQLPGRLPTLLATCFLAAALLLWAAIVQPVNATIVAAWRSAGPNPQSLTPDQLRSPPPQVVAAWSAHRHRWETGHSLAAASQFLALLLLISPTKT